MNKLASRKLWITVGAVITVLVSTSAGLPWYAQAIIAAIGMAYVLAQGYVDAKK